MSTSLSSDVESYSIVVNATVGPISYSGAAFELVVSEVGYGGDITVTSIT